MPLSGKIKEVCTNEIRLANNLEIVVDSFLLPYTTICVKQLIWCGTI